MTTDKIYSTLTTVFREVFFNDELTITETTSALDIPSWDSLQNINLIIAVENRFAVKLTSREIESLKNVGDLVSTISKSQLAPRRFV